MTTLPDFSLEDVRLVLLVDLGRRLEQARGGSRPACHLRVELGRGRGRTRCRRRSCLWQATQLATSNICLPLANDRPLLRPLDRRGQVVELPLLARAVVLEQLVQDRQRVRGQVARRGRPGSRRGPRRRRTRRTSAASGRGRCRHTDRRPACVGAVKSSFCDSRGCEQPAGEQDLVERRHVVPLQGARLRAVASPSRPTSSSDPGCVTTKLCGMRSLFSKTISTGLPAWTAMRSLSKSIWSVTVPRRITRTPSSPSSLADLLGLGRAAAAPPASRPAAGRPGRSREVRSGGGIVRM